MVKTTEVPQGVQSRQEGRRTLRLQRDVEERRVASLVLLAQSAEKQVRRGAGVPGLLCEAAVLEEHLAPRLRNSRLEQRLPRLRQRKGRARSHWPVPGPRPQCGCAKARGGGPHVKSRLGVGLGGGGRSGCKQRL